MKSIAIVGLGPRGSSVLERLITHIIDTNSQQLVTIYLFEKEKKFGPGCHYPTLPDDLLTNTISGQMTMYFGDEMCDFGPVSNGDSLYSWHRKHRDINTEINDYLPRHVLGEYLHDFYLEQISRMKNHNIKFTQINDEVVDVVSHRGWVDVCTNKSKHVVSQAILCIGHQTSSHNDDPTYENFIDFDSLDKIDHSKTIAIQGMGLTACDVISRITQGRGGRYEAVSDRKLRYIPSNREPKFYLFSRSGLFLSGRSFNSDHKYIYTPRFFTNENIDALRKSKGQLDFDHDIIPLLKQELSHAYAAKTKGKELDIDLFFNPENYLNKYSADSFRDSLLSYLHWDIEQSAIGKMDSPHKFCQDAIRDLRDQFRAAIDFRGLTDESFHRFQSYWQPKFLRLCVGPPYKRLMQIQALIEAGICSIDFASNPQIKKGGNHFALICDYESERTETLVDHVIKARSPSMTLCDTPNNLTRNLLDRYKRFIVGGRQYGGLEVSKEYEVMHPDDSVCSNVHAFGIPTEGTKYFTLVLGRPNMVSTFLLDSNNLAKIILNKTLSKKQPNRMAE